MTGHQPAAGTDGRTARFVELVRGIWPELDPRAVARKADLIEKVGGLPNLERYLRHARQDDSLTRGTSHAFFAACARHRIDAWQAKRMRKAQSSPTAAANDAPTIPPAELAERAAKFARQRRMS